MGAMQAYTRIIGTLRSLFRKEQLDRRALPLSGFVGGGTVLPHLDLPAVRVIQRKVRRFHAAAECV